MLLSLLVLVFGSIHAQNVRTATIAWQGVQNVNVDTGDAVEEAHTVISKPTGLEWKKPDGTTQTFTIKETVGQWSNIAQQGEVHYKVSSGQQWGMITFSWDATGVKVKLLLFEEEG